MYLYRKHDRKKNIPRELYFKKIEPFICTGLIKVLTGQRRVGKSYVLIRLIEEIRKRDHTASIIHINKEDYQFGFIKHHTDLIGYLDIQRATTGNNSLFIEEVTFIKKNEQWKPSY